MATTKPFATVPSTAKQQPTPFHLDIDEQKLQDFKTLLRLSPIAKETYENLQTDRRFGVPRDWMLSTKKYWETEFDWRKEEAKINSFPNYTSQITDDDGTNFTVHFTGLFSTRKDAIPIAFVHGWPGSFLEFLPLMSLLKQRYSESDLPYHIIAPSLPGFTLSSPPPLTRDWQIADTSRIIHKLLLSLGFGERGYTIQGGDIGSLVARILAATYPECKAVHFNALFMHSPPVEVPESELTEQEKEGLERGAIFRATGNAYGREHASRPATIGHVMAASPVAQLAWIGEKFLEWTDKDLPLDVVLADVTLYWLCDSFPSSVYHYREDYASTDPTYFHGQKKLFVDKPMGYSYFPCELAPISRAWAEQTGNLVSFKAHQGGGHFASLENTELLWQDVEDLVKVAWK